jgi:hypothetical protein
VFERVKSVMQVSLIKNGRNTYSWSGACAYELVKREGIKIGLFQGSSATLLREIPQFAVYYPTYEYCKKLYKKVVCTAFFF